LHVPEHTQDKDLVATADVAPKKLTGGKKNRVAPGSGEPDDDSELGLEELLLQDEAARGDGVAAKKIKEKPAAGKGEDPKRQHFTCYWKRTTSAHIPVYGQRNRCECFDLCF
jgi:hypothetical protein